MTTAPKTIVGVIGGSGLYSMNNDVEILGEERVTTPFGDPSDVITRVRFGETEALFLPRHGRGHAFLPSEVNYRANIYALKLLGASWCISVSAVGSLRENIHPGDVVIPDQMIDRTAGRASTFFGRGIIAHVSMADPFCPTLREHITSCAASAAGSFGFGIHGQGTYICIEGPQFSTRAESHMYRSWGADIIGMTNFPEARLAREAELAYGTMALVTDYDCWKNDGSDVEAMNIIDVLRKNTQNAQRMLSHLLPTLAGVQPSKLASCALDQAIFSDISKASPTSVKSVEALLRRYQSKPG